LSLPENIVAISLHKKATIFYRFFVPGWAAGGAFLLGLHFYAGMFSL
jgi:hypothetical protein